jgi:putative tryptophan/tyrosine transport system substrate-binding protein
MNRRELITLLGGAASAFALFWPLVAYAQQPPRPVIGVLASAGLDSFAERMTALRQGFVESGFVEGQNVTIEFRSAEGRSDRLRGLAAELVRRQVNVLATSSTAAALAAKRETATIPIVFSTGADPVEIGLVARLNRPGGNVTGMSFLVNKLVAKRLELLNALAPDAATIGMLVDPSNPNVEADTKDARAAADALGRTLLVVNAASEHEVDQAYGILAEQRVSALLVAAHVNLTNWHDRIVTLAARHAVAASYPAREYVRAGGLMSYGPDQRDVYRQVGRYVGRILKGEKAADLPVMQPTKFEFVINLKTAKALGLTVPLIMQMTADEVIE